MRKIQLLYLTHRFAAAKALANFPQYVKDFSALINSDFLKQRRSGLQQDVNARELAEAIAGAKNPIRKAIGYLLQKGFTPTQIADSFAIASGGAAFYRNRINTYLAEGMSKKDAEAKAKLEAEMAKKEAEEKAKKEVRHHTLLESRRLPLLIIAAAGGG